MSYRILLVEDDEVISERVKAALSKAGYYVDIASDGQAGIDMAAESAYGLVILDVMLPKRNGWEACQAIRQSGNPVPILMLTALDDVEDRVRGLEVGADDYLPKPFDFRELLARVQAQLRRDKLHRARIVQIADLTLDITARTVLRKGEMINLTPYEYALLEALALNEGRTLTREVIQERVWGNDESFSNIVSYHVALLRKKIDSGRHQKLIHTVHGIGYVLRADAEYCK